MSSANGIPSQLLSIDHYSLYAEPASIAWLRDHYSSELKSDQIVIVSPDAGGVKICHPASDATNPYQALPQKVCSDIRAQGNINSLPIRH